MKFRKQMLKAAGVCLAMAVMFMTASLTSEAASGSWQQGADGRWWYQYENGTYPYNKWESIDGNWYWFDASGYMVTDWQYINGSWYYFNEGGAMLTGLRDIGGRRFYLAEDGKMMTGWHRVNGVWSYFGSNGAWIDNNVHEWGSIKGIDVSKWQGNIDWAAVKNYGMQFAFVRVGHGTHELDSYYDRNMRGANAVGLPVGVYFYSTATTVEQSIEDAKFVINSMKGYTVSYPVVVDVEDRAIQGNLSKAQVTAITKAFCDEIRAAGYTPMFYCDEDWFRSKIDASQLQNVERWIARYNVTYSEDISRGIWQTCSTGRIDGIQGNVDIDFAYKDYTQIVTPRTGPVAGYGTSSAETGQWIYNNIGWWYSYYGGGFPVSQWELIGDKWYYFNSAGYMVTGWQNINGQWYYLEANGAMAIGWRYIGNNWYYLDEGGAMATGWRYIGDRYYYMDASGVMQTGWVKIWNTWYYLEPSGAMATGWQYLGNNWYYMDESGAMVTGWRYIGDRYFYMNASGVMQTGWLKLGDYWYYLDAGGAMQTGWVAVGNTWYYFNPNGDMAVNTWIDNYYVDASGALTATR